MGRKKETPRHVLQLRAFLSGGRGNEDAEGRGSWSTPARVRLPIVHWLSRRPSAWWDMPPAAFAAELAELLDGAVEAIADGWSIVGLK
jgi:hypothetical protein